MASVGERECSRPALQPTALNQISEGLGKALKRVAVAFSWSKRYLQWAGRPCRPASQAGLADLSESAHKSLPGQLDSAIETIRAIYGSRRLESSKLYSFEDKGEDKRGLWTLSFLQGNSMAAHDRIKSVICMPCHS